MFKRCQKLLLAGNDKLSVLLLVTTEKAIYKHVVGKSNTYSTTMLWQLFPMKTFKNRI